ncbi:Eukaryotic translation initiation factor 2-alpha kinase [Haplosporangium sp. Z 767]|nr:Eukaryotic translation initiation factor 2-alpha kinase [Haplosporangium sp. Z 767]KAF9184930.1 Eukaryotic translation initiation factor 2-alpha kinase [Haplosporangium sp. Z 11]
MDDKDTDESSSKDRVLQWSPRSSRSSSPRVVIDSEGVNLGSVRLGRVQGQNRPDHEVFASFTLSPEKREKKLVRNATVMTLHSDSESEYEVSSENEPSQDLSLSDGGSAVVFDNELSSSNGNEGHSVTYFEYEHSTSVSAADGSRSNSVRRFVWHGPGTSDEDEDRMTTDDDIHLNPAELFNQDSDIGHEEGTDNNANLSDVGECEDEYGDEDEDDNEGDEDEDNNGSGEGRIGMKKVLGSYLLTPMGFDDEENAGPSTVIEGYVEAAERFQIFAGANQFDDSDHMEMEDHAYQVIPKGKRKDQERILENKRRQGKLLLVSLLDNFCLLYDQSPERNRKLFYVICKTLSNMGIIDEEYLEEMSAVRSSYQRAFRSLVLSALSSIKHEQMILESRRIMAPPSTPTEGRGHRRGANMTSKDSSQSISDSFSSKGMVPSAYLHTPAAVNTSSPPTMAMMRTLSFGDMFDNDPTRYKHDFVEICKLGKGGFASVFKARNKLDGIEYAIKKIRLRGGVKVRYEKIFREIKFLARLDHKNVIRYYSSWLEHADYPVSRRETYGNGGADMDSNGDLDDEYDDEYFDEEDETSTVGMRDAIFPGRPRRMSIDYFDPHAEQHLADPEDLSMGIVFGDDDGNESGSAGIDFEYAGNHQSDLDEHDDAGHRIGSTSTEDNRRGGQENEGEDMERTHSASSTLTSRTIPGSAKNTRERRKHKAPTVSQEMQGRTPSWELPENSSSQTKSSMSTSYSALSSSIEEIQRSLPNSYSGSGLGSRYGSSHDQGHKDHMLETLESEHEIRPFIFPNLKETNRKDFVGGGIGRLHGAGAKRTEPGPRSRRNSAGQLITRDLTLFIQMQLCQTTLQDYLVYRNERPTIVPKKAAAELSKKISKVDRFGLLSSPSNTLADQKTQSTPGSPLQQTCHKDLVDPAANQHIFRAIVEGVAYIHDQDMIHRDLKPSNIFLGMPPGSEPQRARQDHCGEDLISTTQSGTFAALAIRDGQHDPFTFIQDRRSSLESSATSIPLTKEQIQEELFMNIENMVPKIGDFGLVTDMDGGANVECDGPQGTITAPSGGAGASESAPPLLRRHSSTVTTGSRSSRTRTTAVGTVTYASPEQLARPSLGYDQKADIYSLGIIFFELYHPFSTLMERHAVLRTLRNGELPPDFVSRWPKEAAFVLWLMAEDPQMRPTAREILEFDLIRKPREEIVSDPVVASETSKRTSSDGDPQGISAGVQESSEMLNLLKELQEFGLSANMAHPDPASVMICQKCQSQLRPSEEAQSIKNTSDAKDSIIGNATASCGTALKTSQSDPTKRHSRGHRPSKSTSSKSSRAELEQRLAEGSEKVKRLEMSMTAMREENKALLDRIQVLEYEKELSWRSRAGEGYF